MVRLCVEVPNHILLVGIMQWLKYISLFGSVYTSFLVTLLGTVSLKQHLNLILAKILFSFDLKIKEELVIFTEHCINGLAVYHQ